MIDLVWDNGFKRKYKKKISSNSDKKDNFWEAMEIFSSDPFDSRLRTHKLTGQLKGLWAFTVDYDCRVVFRFLSDREILLIDIGGHDDVY
jgi:proteic killer suppression protein